MITPLSGNFLRFVSFECCVRLKKDIDNETIYINLVKVLVLSLISIRDLINFRQH